jgi:hypothetical protein
MVTLNIEVTPLDFEQLTTNSMEGGSHWLKQQDRFEIVSPSQFGVVPIATSKYLHWCETYASVMLCRAFLDNQQHGCFVAWDIAAMEYVICTNYPGPFKDKK